MNIISLTRQLGAAIQADERYLQCAAAQAACDADEALQAGLERIQEIQVAYRREAEQPEPDEARMAACDREFNQVYDRIMENPRMQIYEAARGALDGLMHEINGILMLCAQGADPASCEPEPEGCGGDCSGCNGCA